MDAADARSLTEKHVARSVAKFMKKFDRKVARTARKGKKSICIEFFATPKRRVHEYEAHLDTLGYRVVVNPDGTNMTVVWY